MTDDLFAHYRNTDYEVDDAGQRFTIRIDEPCPAVDALLSEYSLEEWAYLTAFNPGPVTRTRGDNLAAQRELVDAARALKLPVLQGVGRAREGDHAEDSVLVLGLSLDEAKRLGGRFGQYAIVAGRRGGVARLVDLRPEIGGEMRQLYLDAAKLARALAMAEVCMPCEENGNVFLFDEDDYYISDEHAAEGVLHTMVFSLGIHGWTEELTAGTDEASQLAEAVRTELNLDTSE